jgi:hypothetical protein
MEWAGEKQKQTLSQQQCGTLKTSVATNAKLMVSFLSNSTGT